MLKSGLCDNSDACILLKGTITITEPGVDPAARKADEVNKQLTLKNCVLFTDCISKINNTQVDNAKNLHIVMQMDNLIE